MVLFAELWPVMSFSMTNVGYGSSRFLDFTSTPPQPSYADLLRSNPSQTPTFRPLLPNHDDKTL